MAERTTEHKGMVHGMQVADDNVKDSFGTNIMVMVEPNEEDAAVMRFYCIDA